MLREFTIEEIMERLSRICRKQNCGIRVRPDFPIGPTKWYLYLSGVVMASIDSGAFCSTVTSDCNSGETPEDAIRNVWRGILRLEKDTRVALMRYNCPSNIPIPGEEPQVWVRWNSTLDDWEDVPVRRLPPEKIRNYKDQHWRDKEAPVDPLSEFDLSCSDRKEVSDTEIERFASKAKWLLIETVSSSVYFNGELDEFYDKRQPPEGFQYPKVGARVTALKNYETHSAKDDHIIPAGAIGKVVEIRMPGSYKNTPGYIGCVMFFQETAESYRHGIVVPWDMISYFSFEK